MQAKISKAQLTVLEWKDKAYEEIKHLPIQEQMRLIHESTRETVAKINRKKSAKRKALLSAD